MATKTFIWLERVTKQNWRDLPASFKRQSLASYLDGEAYLKGNERAGR